MGRGVGSWPAGFGGYPNLLPVLKKAGVVDAGGQGIMVIFEGMGKGVPR